jgi:hypothetical protein
MQAIIVHVHHPVSVSAEARVERSLLNNMAKFYSSSVILLVLFVAAWKTTLVASHFFRPDFGRR